MRRVIGGEQRRRAPGGNSYPGGWRGTMDWEVPVGSWAGEEVVVIGGGPSVALLDPALLAGRRVIATNEAGLTVAPTADILFFGDGRWFRWNTKRIAQLWRGGRLVTRTPIPDTHGLRVYRLRGSGRTALSEDPTKVAGPDSGACGVNLAYLLGPPSRIVLIGMDMHGGHFHSRHPRETPASRYTDVFLPAWRRMSLVLAQKGVPMVNASPGSVLNCVPTCTAEEALG